MWDAAGTWYNRLNRDPGTASTSYADAAKKASPAHGAPTTPVAKPSSPSPKSPAHGASSASPAAQTSDMEQALALTTDPVHALRCFPCQDPGGDIIMPQGTHFPLKVLPTQFMFLQAMAVEGPNGRTANALFLDRAGYQSTCEANGALPAIAMLFTKTPESNNKNKVFRFWHDPVVCIPCSRYYGEHTVMQDLAGHIYTKAHRNMLAWVVEGFANSGGKPFLGLKGDPIHPNHLIINFAGPKRYTHGVIVNHNMAEGKFGFWEQAEGRLVEIRSYPRRGASIYPWSGFHGGKCPMPPHAEFQWDLSSMNYTHDNNGIENHCFINAEFVMEARRFGGSLNLFPSAYAEDDRCCVQLATFDADSAPDSLYNIRGGSVGPDQYEESAERGHVPTMLANASLLPTQLAHGIHLLPANKQPPGPPPPEMEPGAIEPYRESWPGLAEAKPQPRQPRMPPSKGVWRKPTDDIPMSPWEFNDDNDSVHHSAFEQLPQRQPIGSQPSASASSATVEEAGVNEPVTAHPMQVEVPPQTKQPPPKVPLAEHHAEAFHKGSWKRLQTSLGNSQNIADAVVPSPTKKATGPSAVKTTAPTGAPPAKGVSGFVKPPPAGLYPERKPSPPPERKDFKPESLPTTTVTGDPPSTVVAEAIPDTGPTQDDIGRPKSPPPKAKRPKPAELDTASPIAAASVIDAPPAKSSVESTPVADRIATLDQLCKNAPEEVQAEGQRIARSLISPSRSHSHSPSPQKRKKELHRKHESCVKVKETVRELETEVAIREHRNRFTQEAMDRTKSAGQASTAAPAQGGAQEGTRVNDPLGFEYELRDYPGSEGELLQLHPLAGSPMPPGGPHNELKISS